METGKVGQRVPVICPVQNAGADPFADPSAKNWPWIVFQVFWSPSGGCPFPGDTVILLGEAFAPPLNTIPGQRTALCLKLRQAGRRPPNGCKPYEDWLNKIWPEYQDRKQREIDLERKKKERKQKQKSKEEDKRMKTELEAIANDLAKESEEAGFGYTEHYLYSPEELIIKAWKEESKYLLEQNRKDKCQHQEKDLPPIRLADGTVARAPQRPQRASKAAQPNQQRSEIGVHNSDLCFVDVDLAWTTEVAPDTGYENELGADGPQVFGSLMIYSLTARVPPCNEGQLRIRIAEVETVATATPKPAIHHDVGATDTCRSLCAQLMERDVRVTPVAPSAHSLWESRERMLGQNEDTKSFCEWGTEAFVKLQVTPCQDLKKERRRNMINDVVQSCMPPKRPPPERREVGLMYKPVQMRQPVPMPRNDFVMMPGSLFEPPSRTPATEADFTTTPPRRVRNGRSGSTPLAVATPTNWMFDPPSTEGDKRPLESRTPRGLGRAGNMEGMSAALLRSTSRDTNRLIGDAAFLQSTGGCHQLHN